MKCKICGSMAINPHLHGRDETDLDLCDVCFWRKRAGEKQSLRELLEKQHNDFRKHLFAEHNRFVLNETTCLNDCEICKILKSIN